MASGLVDIMKQAALAAMDDHQPSDIRFGVVTSISPLKIQITPEFILSSKQLVVPQYLTDYEIDITVTPEGGWVTETHTHTHNIYDTYTGGGSASEHTHRHNINGRKTITIHAALKVGDKVALVRKSGGQSFLILDRISN